MPGSGTLPTGLEKVTEKPGSFALFASSPMQYSPGDRLASEMVFENPSPLLSVWLPTELQADAAPAEKTYRPSTRSTRNRGGGRERPAAPVKRIIILCAETGDRSGDFGHRSSYEKHGI